MKRVLAFILVFGMVIGFVPAAKAGAEVSKKQVIGTWEAWRIKCDGVTEDAKDRYENYTISIKEDGTFTLSINGMEGMATYQWTQKGISVHYDNGTKSQYKLKKGKLYLSEYDITTIFKKK